MSLEQASVTNSDLTRLTTDVVAAYLMQHQVATGQLPQLIQSVFNALSEIVSGAPVAPDAAPPSEPLKPAVSVKRSVTDHYIVCLEDGKKLKMLKRHLRAHYNLTPEAYREKWGLPADYPMVAPAYARQRSDFAKKIGLGRSPKTED